MPEVTRKTIEAYIVELRKRAERSQEEARQTFNPLYGDDKRPPRDFVESSYLFIRSCDADFGSRPLPCPVFWLSPDLRVAPLSNVGAATTELHAGDAYRLTATVRNRGDLMVPAAKVEFYLVNPTLGFDTRFATKLGVGTERVQAHGASEVSLDYVVPPALGGHRCLFARVFAFSPLDVPIDDYALDPRIDRHIDQLNLNIVGQATSLTLDWIHPGNALERLVIAPMAASVLRELRLEAVSALALVDDGRWAEASSRVTFETKVSEGAAVQIDEREGGLALSSTMKEGVPLEEQVELTKRVQAALRALERGRGDATEYRKLFRRDDRAERADAGDDRIARPRSGAGSGRRAQRRPAGCRRRGARRDRAHGHGPAWVVLAEDAGFSVDSPRLVLGHAALIDSSTQEGFHG